MASNVEDLRAAVEVLQNAYDRARARLYDEGFPNPLEVVDADGRYILLDAVTALVNARSTLANAERS